MLFQLPTFHAQLDACPVDPATFTLHAAGSFCGSCQRVVHDFTQAEHPLAELAAARTASPDGRVCGSFRVAQLAAPPTLTRRLKWFVLALVLVVGQGLTAQQAMAQVHKAKPHTHTQIIKKKAHQPPHQLQTVTVTTSGTVSTDIVDVMEPPAQPGGQVYTYAEQMPSFRGGGNQELVAYLNQQVRRPQGPGMAEVEGRVFVSLVVGKDGSVRDAKILKGIHSLFDAEVIRVVQGLTGFTPGRQNGQPVAVSLTLPVTFQKEKK